MGGAPKLSPVEHPCVSEDDVQASPIINVSIFDVACTELQVLSAGRAGGRMEKCLKCWCISFMYFTRLRLCLLTPAQVRKEQDGLVHQADCSFLP